MKNDFPFRGSRRNDIPLLSRLVVGVPGDREGNRSTFVLVKSVLV